MQRTPGSVVLMGPIVTVTQTGVCVHSSQNMWLVCQCSSVHADISITSDWGLRFCQVS